MVSNQGSWTLRLTSKNTPKLLDWKTLVRSSTGFSTASTQSGHWVTDFSLGTGPPCWQSLPYKGRRHLVSDSGPWPYVSRPTFVLSSPNHVNEKRAEATEQQDSACR